MKRGEWVSTKTIIALIIGGIVLGILAGFILPEHFPKAAMGVDFLVGKGKDLFTKEEFVPYEDELTEDEKTVRDSVNALVCGINSVAMGEFEKDNEVACSREGVSISYDETPTARVIGMVTGDSNIEKVSYGTTSVSCEGVASEFLELSRLREGMIEDLANAVKKCLDRGKKSKLKNEFTKCAYFEGSLADSYEKLGTPITERDIKRYLINQGREDAARSLDLNNLARIPSHHGGCIYYNKNIGRDTVIIDDCTKDDPVETFSCTIEGFELPQDISKAQKFIQAMGDPNWLVYYEKFPEEATVYWHKEWSDMFNLYTIGFVTVSGVMNIGFGGKGGKVALKAGKEAFEKTGKEIAEKVVKEGVEAGSKHLLRRAKKASLKNILRSVLVQEESMKVFGVGKKTAESVGDIIANRMGKKTGKEAFEKAKNSIYSDVLDLLKKNKLRRPPSLRSGAGEITTDAYRRQVAELLIEGGESIDGQAIKGMREIFEKKLTKEMVSGVLERQTYRQFFTQFVDEGTGEINELILRKNAEKALRRVVALNEVGDELVEKSFREGAKKVERILAQGTIGYKEGDSILQVVKKQIPLKLPHKQWALLGPVGLAGAGIESVALGIPIWVKDHPLSGVLLLSVLIDFYDSTNDKFVPIGVDSIAAKAPNLLSQKVTKDLVEESSRYFIRNKVNPGRGTYFVSPCKANIKITRGKCDCANNPQDDMFNFGGGLMNTEHGTITLKDYEDITEIYRRRWLDSERIQESYPNIDDYIELEYRRTEEAFEDLILSSGIDPNGVPKDALGSFREYVDYSNAVKTCRDREVVGDMFNYGKKFGYGFLKAHGISDVSDAKWEKAFAADIDFSVDCIELETERIEGYCYDHFPKTEWVRTGFTVISLVADAAIIGFTGGLATPLAMVGSGMAFAALDTVLENLEKWP